jgi:predicted dehydrogenase
MHTNDHHGIWTRRNFVKSSGIVALGALAPTLIASETRASQEKPLKVGVIGCGGRGTGAASDALEASPRTRIVALADAFEDQVRSSRENLTSLGERAKVDESRCYVGFDAFAKLLASDVDVVILATPPHFRPMHFEAAIAAGKHVFMEKPVATDSPGIRKVLAAAEQADAKKLCVVAGTQRRHEKCYLEAMQRLKEGAIGKIVAGRVYWNMGTLWSKPQKPEWSDMEWQMRNWLYFTWLSGDHYVEQHVHNLDVANWAIGAHPTRCMGMGGRQVRVEPLFGNVFDHFAVEYEYPGGEYVMSMARQTDDCANRVDERLHGTKGVMRTHPGAASIKGENEWKFAGDNGNPYVDEHVHLYHAIDSGSHVNEAKAVAESTLTAIMGRMSAYTGQEITWDKALNSTEDLSPAKYEFGPYPVAPVATPGKTKFA